MDNYAYAYNFLLNYNIHRVNSQLLIYKINCDTLKVTQPGFKTVVFYHQSLHPKRERNYRLQTDTCPRSILIQELPLRRPSSALE